MLAIVYILSQVIAFFWWAINQTLINTIRIPNIYEPIWVRAWNHFKNAFTITKQSLDWLAGIVITGWDAFIEAPFLRLYNVAIWVRSFFLIEIPRTLASVANSFLNGTAIAGGLLSNLLGSAIALRLLFIAARQWGMPVAATMDGAILRLEQLARAAFDSTRVRTNLLSGWLNVIVHPWSVGQPGFFVRSLQVYAPLLVHHVAGRGVLEDPGPALEQLRAEHPSLPVPQLVQMVNAGYPTQEPQLVAGLALFRQLMQ